VRIALVVLLGTGLAACGGGGDGEQLDRIIGRLDGIVRYQLETKPEGLVASLGPASVVFSSSGATRLTGSVDADTGALSIDAGVVATLTDESEALIGTFSLNVTQELRFPQGAHGLPTEGQFVITGTLFTEVVRITVDNTIPGVKLEIDTDGDPEWELTADLKWQELFDLEDTGSAAEASGSAAFGVLEFVFSRVANVLDSIDSIQENADLLEDVGQVDLPCAPMPADLPEVANPGSVNVSWTGGAGIDAGDDFLVTYSDCFEPDGAAEGTLLDAILSLEGLVLETDAAGVPTRLGFTRCCFLGGFTVTDVFFENDMAAVDAVVVLSGGFALEVARP